MTALHAWALATVVGGLIGWGIWRRWHRPIPMGSLPERWLAAHATGETKAGWRDGPRWRFSAEREEQAREARVTAAKARLRVTGRRKEGAA